MQKIFDLEFLPFQSNTNIFQDTWAGNQKASGGLLIFLFFNQLTREIKTYFFPDEMNIYSGALNHSLV